MSEMKIRRYEDAHLAAVVRLSLRAWQPVFESIERVMDPDVYRAFHPDWRVTQRDAVTEVCADPNMSVWVADEGTSVVGFVALRTDTKTRMGEIYMIAVDPAFQRRGVATALTNHSLAWFKERGMSVAMVDTGGDPGHAPARRTYEATGFRVLPIARYFKKI
jgi:ribosomal protein S18 acetylase RimI-like enzyme